MLVIIITQHLAVKCPKDGDGGHGGMCPQRDGGFATSQPSLLQTHTDNQAGRVFHRAGMEINGFPEPSVYLFIAAPAVRFLPYLNSVSKALASLTE